MVECSQPGMVCCRERCWRGGQAVSICPDSLGHLILDVKALGAAAFSKETWCLAVPGLLED